MSRARVKICGLREPRHATATSRAGADYVGVVFAGGVREITAGEAAGVVEALEGGTRAVGVFVDAGPAEILVKRDIAEFHVAQLAGSEPPELCDRLRDEGWTSGRASGPRRATRWPGGGTSTGRRRTRSSWRGSRRADPVVPGRASPTSGWRSWNGTGAGSRSRAG